jgi:protein-S-isoprenylcysteine O-methyltransferase Ste14
VWLPVGDVVRVLARRRVALGFVAGATTLILTSPTWSSWRAGLAISLVGEAIRVWAAGHLEKGREVTRSGPYRWTSHPLYLGSSVIALGVVVASRSWVVAVLVASYMTATISAAIQTEEAFLRKAFGSAYDDYKQLGAGATKRRFSAARALRNREYRALLGLGVGFMFLALKIVLSI